MFLSRRRIILIGVITAIAATIVLLPLILTITLPSDLNQLTISVSKVEAVNPDVANDTQRVQLNVYFNVYNPLGQGILSYEDIPLNGRPQLYYHSNTTLKSLFEPTYSNANILLLNKMLSNPDIVKQIKWRVEGEAQIESGFSSTPKQFNAEL
jgi:hypothetical protein